MKKYLFLSSAFLMTMAGANAADKIITSANTCTVDVLGVHENDATANTIATWDLIDYTLNPGQYLSVTETSVDKATCPAGSYCVGGGYTVETADNSIAQCPTGYPNSANGASADTQCYTACTVATANIAHATAVSGNDYYGGGVDTCGATACETGYHVKPGLNLTDTIGTTDAGTGYTSNDNYGDDYDSDEITPSDAGIAGDPMAFATPYGDKGMITGHGRCSTQKGVFDFNSDTNIMTEITIVDSLPDTTGQYCYCQLDGYKSASGEVTPITSAPWVFLDEDGSADNCASTCAFVCANSLRNVFVSDRAFRAAVFNASSTSATCAANTINIDWNPDNGGAHTQNMCTYDGSITVPADPVKPGYTFMGWKLVE